MKTPRKSTKKKTSAPTSGSLAGQAELTPTITYDVGAALPTHYTEGRKFETWDVLDDWFPQDPLLWNATKYLSRAGRKGSLNTDLSKALTYILRRMEKEHSTQ